MSATGVLDAYAAAMSTSTAAANAGLGRSSGRGSLDASRGEFSTKTVALPGTVISGTQTAQLLVWDPVAFTTGDWTASTWYTAVHGKLGWQQLTWNGHNWGGHNWGGHNWGGHNWGGHNWGGHNWGGSSWYGQADKTSAYGTGPQGPPGTEHGTDKGGATHGRASELASSDPRAGRVRSVRSVRSA
jgi:hypothetical protein